MPENATRCFFAVQVNRGNGIAIHNQLLQALRGILVSGVVPAGTPLPGEHALCRAYGISRSTLRQVMDHLEREGLIKRRRGAGTFASAPRIQHDEQVLSGFIEHVRQMGRTPSTRLLSFAVAAPSAEAAEFYGMGRDEQVFRFERLRFGDDTPLVLEVDELSCSLCPGLNRFDFEKESLYRVLEEEYGLDLAYSFESIVAQHPNARQRRLFQIPPSTALLVVREKTYTSTDVAAAYAITIYRGDLYSLGIRSTRPRSRR